MPYLITTTRVIGPHEGDKWPVTDRLAVATLGKARDEAALIVAAPDHDESWDEFARAAYDLPEIGGTVALPDGTVIQVKRVTRASLGDIAWPRQPRKWMQHTDERSGR